MYPNAIQSPHSSPLNRRRAHDNSVELRSLGLPQKSVRVETVRTYTARTISEGFAHDTPAKNRDFVYKPLTWWILAFQDQQQISKFSSRHSR